MKEWEEGPKIFGTLKNEKERRQLRIQMAINKDSDELVIAIQERVELIAEGVRKKH
ncbi:hypothetical protein BY996DRAFT_6576205 [Phakopsora pachyrhizi]|nr:hypothetical protein BY996DRAFT_6576205 [Phakopsora pachyrhizi]